MEQPILETRDLTKVYGDGIKFTALDHVDLCIAPGEIIAIVGPSGSGKSTLLNLIGALDKPSSGEVFIDGQALSKIRNLDGFRSATIGFIFQTHNLLPTLTARENVEVPMHERRMSGRARRKRAEELLALVGLGEKINSMPNQMSGGQRQRVAIARALANEPAIVLADEPTGNLDTQTTADIMALLSELNTSQGVTLVLVTHNNEVAAAAQRVVTLRDGKIQQDVALREQIQRDLLEFRGTALGQAVLRGDPLPHEIEEHGERLREALLTP
jgi:ABC-type lipoprotein export system ATPase subunit